MIQSLAIRILTFVLLFLFLLPPVPAGAAEETDNAKKAAIDLFVSHLRRHFDDIHDVSMRYHLHDPSLGGVIVLRMTWEEERLASATVEENETGSAAEAASLIEAISKWRIEGLGDVSFTIPFRITMVGSDDPEFHHRAILTGTVRDPSGRPLSGAVITLTLVKSGAEKAREITANSEGVYIKSLIPSGTWSIQCALPGYHSRPQDNVTLAAGEHRILHLVLEPD